MRMVSQKAAAAGLHPCPGQPLVASKGNGSEPLIGHYFQPPLAAMWAIWIADDESISAVLDHVDGLHIQNLVVPAKFLPERVECSPANALIRHE